MRFETNDSASWMVAAIALACTLSWCCLQASACQIADYEAKTTRCKAVVATSADAQTIVAVCKGIQ